MNHIYRIIWNPICCQFQAVCELAHGRGKNGSSSTTVDQGGGRIMCAQKAAPHAIYPYIKGYKTIVSLVVSAFLMSLSTLGLAQQNVIHVGSGGKATIPGTYAPGSYMGGSIADNGSLTLNAKFINTDELENKGTLANEKGGLLQNDGGIKNYKRFMNASTFDNNGTLLNMERSLFSNSWHFNNNANASVENNGMFVNSSKVVNQGTFTNKSLVSTNHSFSNEHIVQNSGTFSNEMLGRFENKGELTNVSLGAGASAVFNNNQGATFSNFKNVTNQAQFNNNGKLLNDSSATLLNNGGTIIHGETGEITNKGTISNQAGTFASRGKITNETGASIINAQGAIFSHENLAGSPPFYVFTNKAGAQVNNSGLMRNTSTLDNEGAITNTSTGTIENKQRLSNIGDLTNSGTFNNIGNANLINTGNLANNQLFNNRGSLVNQGTLSNAGQLDSYNYIENTLTFNNTGTLNNYGHIDNKGTLTSNGSLRIYDNATFDNKGDLKINAELTNRGGVLMNANGATLTLDNAQINNSLGTSKINNQGQMHILSSTNIDNRGELTNSSTGHITTSGNASISNARVINNSGTFHITEQSRLENSRFGAFINTNGGKLEIQDASSRLDNYGMVINHIGILHNKGEFIQKGNVANFDEFTNSNKIELYGGFFNGTDTIQTGSFLNEENAVLSMKDESATLVNYATLHNLGTISILGTVENYGNFTNLGTVLIGDGSSATAQLSGDIKLQGPNAKLIFNRSENQTYDGVLTGSGEIIKRGNSFLLLTGDNSGFLGKATVNQGVLRVGDYAHQNIQLGGDVSVESGAAISGVGKIGGVLDLQSGSYFSANATVPYLEVNGVEIANGVQLNISGVGEDPSGYVFLRSQTPIQGSFDSILVSGSAQSNVDYVKISAFIVNNVDYVAKFDLSWLAGANNAHGTFTLTNKNDQFTVATALKDETISGPNLPNWDGKTLTKKGEGILVLNGANTYTGDTVVEKGRLVIGRNSAYANAQVAGNTIVRDQAAISGVGSIQNNLTIESGGTLLVENASSPSHLRAAGAFLNDSTLIIQDFDIQNYTPGDAFTILEASTAIQGEFGTVDISQIKKPVDYLSVRAFKDGNDYKASYDLSWLANTGNAHGTFTLNNPIDSYTVQQVLSNQTSSPLWDGQTLTKAGLGTLTLNEVNTFTGDTVVQGGKLVLGDDSHATAQVAGNLNVMNGAMLEGLGTVGGTLHIEDEGIFLADANKAALNAHDAVLDANSVLNIQGLGTNTSDIGVEKVILHTTNGITSQWGKINYNDPAGNVDYLQFRTFIDGNDYKASYDLSWLGDTGRAHGTFTLANQSDFFIVNNDLQNQNAQSNGWDGQTLTKLGDGKLILNGTNTFTGDTLVQGGKLVLGSDDTHATAQVGGNLNVAYGAALQGTGTVKQTLTMKSGGMFIADADLQALKAQNVILDANSYLTLEHVDTSAIGNTTTILSTTAGIDGEFGHVIIADGANGPVDYLSVRAFKDGNDYKASYDLSWIANKGNAHGTFTLAAPTESFTVDQNLDNQQASGLWDGRTLTKAGLGTLTLNGVNTFTGDTFVQGGKLVLGDDSHATAQVAGNLNVMNGAILEGLGTVGGTLHIEDGGIFLADANKAALNAHDAVLDANSVLNIQGLGANTSDIGVEKVILHTINGITNQWGTINYNDPAGSVDYLQFRTFIDGNDYKASYDLSWIGDTGRAHGTFTLTGANEAFTVGTALGNQASSALWDGQTLTKAGLGTLTLNGVNTFTGDTVVQGGKLVLGDDSHATAQVAGNLNVMNGAMLEGLGTVGGTLHIEDGGIFLADANKAALNAHDAALDANSVLNIQGLGANTSDIGVEKVILHTTNGITNQWGTINYNDPAGSVDYLQFRTFIDGNDYKASYDLSWIGDTGRAHGTFTLTGANEAFTVDAALSNQASSALWDGQTLTKAGLGILTLNGVNTFTGDTVVQGGKLVLGDDSHATAQVAGNLNVMNGAMLEGLGTVGGTLHIEDGGIFLADANKAALNAHNAVLDANSILEVNGVGTDLGVEKVILHTTNGITGQWGDVRVGGSTGSVDYLNVRTFINGNDYKASYDLSWIANTGIAHGTFTLAGANEAFTVDAALSNQVSSALWDGQTLTKAGLGILTLNGVNTFTGDTVVQGGKLVLGDDSHATAQVAGNLNVMNGAMLEGLGTVGGTLHIEDGGIFLVDANKAALNAHNAVLDANSILEVNGVGTDLGVEKVILHTTNGITGQWGDVRVGGSTGSVDYLNVRTFINGNDYKASYDLSWIANTGIAHGTFTLAGANEAFTVDAALSNQASSALWDGQTLTKAGLGILTLNGVNTFTGDTVVQGGKLVLGDDSHATAQVAGNLNVMNGAMLEGLGTVGGTLHIEDGGIFLADANKAALNAHNAVLDANSILEVNGVGTDLGVEKVILHTTNGITGQWGDVRVGGSTGSVDYLNVRTFINGNDYKASYDLSWIANTGIAHGTFTLAGANEAFTVDAALSNQVSSALWDGQTLTKAGLGILTLNGVNTFTGDTVVQGGKLVLGDDSHATAQVAGNLNVMNGAMLEGLGTVGGTLHIEDGGIFLVDANKAALNAHDAVLDANSVLNIQGLDANTSDIGVEKVILHTTNGITNQWGTINYNDPAGSVDYLQFHTFIDGNDYKASYDLSWIGDTGRAHGTFTLAGANEAFTVGTALGNQVSSALWDGQTLTKAGLGTLTLNGVNTFTGDTVVQGGKLVLGSSATYKHAQVAGTLNVMNGAMLEGLGTVGGTLHIEDGGIFLADANRAALNAYDAVLDANSILDIHGIGTDYGIEKVILHTTNGITGQWGDVRVGGSTGSVDYLNVRTFIDGNDYKASYDLSWLSNPSRAHGTFTLTQDSERFTVGVNLHDQPANARWDGTTLTKNGLGVLALNGKNTYTGLTTVNAGTLLVGATSGYKTAQIAGDVLVGNSATLGGHGQVLGHVMVNNGGTVSPGSSIGTLTVGSITFDANSIYVFEANASGDADLLQVTSANGATGIATINQGANLMIKKGRDGVWSAGSYTLISADNSVVGTFDNVLNELAFLDYQLAYTPQTVELVLKRNDIEIPDLGQTPNEKETGNGITGLEDGDPVKDAITGLDRETVRDALNNLSGEVHSSTRAAVLTNSRFVRDALNQHMIEIDDELTDKSAWVSSWGHKQRIDRTSNAGKLENKSFGFMIGADMPVAVANNTVIGLAAGYERTDVKLNARSSSADVDSFHINAYGKTQVGLVDVRGGFGLSVHKTDTTRNIWVSGIDGKNQTNYRSQMFQGFVEGSHTFAPRQDMQITPYANLAHVRLNTNSFTEKHSASGLHGKKERDNVTLTTIGVRSQWQLPTQKHNVAAYADAGWQHSFGAKTRSNQFNFVSGGQQFKIRGAKMARDTGLIGFGLDGKITDNVQLRVGYEGEFGSGVKDHAAKIQLNIRF